MKQVNEWVKEILQDNYVGVYFHGSLRLGSFNPNKSDLDFVVNVMKDNFSPMLKNFVDFLNQSINFGRNIFIMHRDKFMLYSDFICKCIDILTSDLLQNSDIKERDKYQKRAIGFLLERLTGFWIYD